MYDVITLGSASMDVFVKTRNPEILKHKNHYDVSYTIGQKVLVEDMHIDTGGGGTNTAVAFSRLGLKTGWISRLGNDLRAKNILLAMKKEHVDFLGKQSKGMTGYSVILTNLKHNRTILAYKGVNDQLSSSDVPWKKLNTKWFYFSTMMGKSFSTLKKAVAFAKKKKIKYAFNPSMYLAKKGIKFLKPIIQGCDLLVLNKEEAQAVLGRKTDLLKGLQKYAKLVVITDGPRVVHATDGQKHYQLHPYGTKPVEATGAGDAFAAGTVAGLIIKKDLARALQMGMAESDSVLKKIGAKNNLMTRSEILRKKPAKLIIKRL